MTCKPTFQYYAIENRIQARDIVNFFIQYRHARYMDISVICRGAESLNALNPKSYIPDSKTDKDAAARTSKGFRSPTKHPTSEDPLLGR